MTPELERLYERLSPRQLEVVLLVVQGLTGDGVAAKLGISRTAVEIALSRAMRRLGLLNRGQLMAYHYQGQIADLKAQLEAHQAIDGLYNGHGRSTMSFEDGVNYLLHKLAEE
jgi:DNA-binding CsgD family transcriptional regulator